MKRSNRKIPQDKYEHFSKHQMAHWSAADSPYELLANVKTMLVRFGHNDGALCSRVCVDNENASVISTEYSEPENINR